jgi:protein-S-isoprenylcysteine O-methyltransferase Ste14
MFLGKVESIPTCIRIIVHFVNISLHILIGGQMPPYAFSNSTNSTIFYAATSLWFILEMVGIITQRSSSSGQSKPNRRDRGSLIALLAGMAVGITLAINFIFYFPDARLPAQPVFFYLGIFLLLAGLAFRWYAVIVLGRYFTRDVIVRSDHVVVQHGPYRYIRHPAYSGTLLSMLGLGLAMGNWTSLVALIVCGLAGHLYRVRVEEQALIESIGQPYKDYMSRTRRFIPFIW